jgi:hypothetical protein
MKKGFSGVWATFEYLDDFCSVIRKLKAEGFKNLTTHTPVPRHEIDQALGNPQSKIPFATLAGAFIGFFVAVFIVRQMSLDWVLPVSAKPIVSIPIMGPIAFEMAVLMAIYFTIIGMIYLIAKDTKRTHRPQSKTYLEYDRFMRDRFGIVIPCQDQEIEKVEQLLKHFQPEEVFIEK